MKTSFWRKLFGIKERPKKFSFDGFAAELQDFATRRADDLAKVKLPDTCSSCGRKGLGTLDGSMVTGQGQAMIDYLRNRVWMCNGCKVIFCPDCSLKKYDFKCPHCGKEIVS